MNFVPTGLAGAYLIETTQHADERGSFTRTYCAREFAQQGLHTEWVQHSVSFNRAAGTMRGLHYQAAPHGEIKLISCTAGLIFDVIVDLRGDSPTFQKSFCTELGGESGVMLYVPKGFAHGFLTLEDNSRVTYCISAYYEPTAVRGVRWDDPRIGIPWPRQASVIAERDATFRDIDAEGIPY